MIIPYVIAEGDTTNADKINANFQIIVKQPVFIATTLENSWVNYDGGFSVAGYFKDVNSIVHLRGLVKSGTVGTTSAIFTLPVGFRPTYTQIFVIISNSAIGRCDVTTSGGVIAYTGNNGWFSIDGLSFLAEQ